MTEPTRILIVDDDPDVRTILSVSLARAGYDVTTAADPMAALGTLSELHPALVLVDVKLPQLDGFAFIEAARSTLPDLPVLVMTAYADLDTAVRALRAGATDFLTKPIPQELLTAAITRALAAATTTARRILAIGAHPDDVELGAGGILATHVAAGDDVTILTLSGGATGGDVEIRHQESRAAADRLGAHLVMADLPDTQVEPGVTTIQAIEAVLDECDPQIVYTHSVHDTHQDHRSAHTATTVAARTAAGLYCYAAPSATLDFRPVRFIDIEAALATKLELLECFESQRHRWYLDPELVAARARHWGAFGRLRFAEPLEVVRDPVTTHVGPLEPTIPVHAPDPGIPS